MRAGKSVYRKAWHFFNSELNIRFQFRRVFFFSRAPRRKRRKYLAPPPPGVTASDSDESPSTPSPPLSKYRPTVEVEKVLLDIKDELFRSKNEVPVPQKSRSVVSMIIICIICKEVTMETN